MISQVVQRWKGGRGSYRPCGETIQTDLFEISAIDRDVTAKEFVLANHYSGSYPAARFRFGLWKGDELQGVAVFSVPCNYRTLAVLPGDPKESVELGRFVLVDDVPANGESWFLARCFELLRRDGIVGVVSFSDPVGRTAVDGREIFAGHVGTIYQATNAVFLGRSKAERRRLLPDGSLLHGRALTKIRNRRKGFRYAAAQLEEHGATSLEDGEDARAWCERWTSELTRPLSHPGNLKYAWTLSKRDRKHLPESLPYPKVSARLDVAA